MAQIPFTGLSSLAPAGTIGVPDDYTRVNADPNAFGAGIGAATQKLGAAGVEAGGTALDIATRNQQIYNETAVNNAFTDLRDQVTNSSWGDPNDPNSRGYLTMTGADAMRGYDDAMTRLKNRQSDIRITLSPPQQRAFDRASNNLLSATQSSYDQHRATQQQVWANQSSDATAQSAQSAAIAAPPNDPAFLHNLADGQNAVVQKGNRLGWSPEVLGQQIAAYRSSTYVGATERMAAVNPQQAWTYYTQNQRNFTGQDQLALESRLRPSLLAWGSRDTADGLIRTYGGGVPTGPVPDMVKAAATQQGLDPQVALTSARIESGLGTLPDRPGSQYQGIFQMGDGAWAARGGTASNRGDLSSQVQLGVANLKHSQDVATQALGQTAAGWQTYVVHQQGDAGGPALLTANPSTSAVDALTPAYKGDPAAATAAIVKNGGTSAMSAGQFLDVWQRKYQAASAGLGGGTSKPPDPIVIGDSLARGIGDANKLRTDAEVGLQPDAVLDKINAIGANDVRGQSIILSSGISNDPSKLTVVQQQLDSLKARGANVTLVGVGSRADLAPLNAQLQEMAQKSGATFLPIQAGPDGVHPADYKGLGVAAAQPAQQAATGPAAFRANVPAMMDAASKVLDPFGQSNPQFVDQVQSRIRAKLNEQEYAQREADKGARDTLLGAAMGLPASAPSSSAPGSSPGPTSQARPTSLDQLLQNPDAKDAWLAASPETQRSTLQLLEHNAHGQDPPMTPAAQALFYQLSGMATNDRESFQKLDLSDPKYTGALPHSYWNQLAGEQRRFGNADVTRAAREESQARALTILKPDLLGAGFKIDGLKPGSTAAQTYDQFVGRLRESLDQFQQDNKRRPTDAEVATLGKSLLLQGTQRGSAASSHGLPTRKCAPSR